MILYKWFAIMFLKEQVKSIASSSPKHAGKNHQTRIFGQIMEETHKYDESNGASTQSGQCSQTVGEAEDEGTHQE